MRRSQDQFDLITLQLAFRTPTHVLKQLDARIGEYLRKHSSQYHPKYELEYRELENTNRIVLRIWVQHRSNFQNMRRYRERRTRVLLFLKRVCEELCITYEFPPQHVFGTTPTAPGALPVDFYQTPAPMMASN